jgi:hypothetical protein
MEKDSAIELLSEPGDAGLASKNRQERSFWVAFSMYVSVHFAWNDILCTQHLVSHLKSPTAGP